MESFRVCTSCGYGRGFHVFFRETEEGTAIGLICPNCGQSFDIGWTSGPMGGTPQKGPVYPSK